MSPTRPQWHAHDRLCPAITWAELVEFLAAGALSRDELVDVITRELGGDPIALG